jgi:2-keto-4-pentenoate hydratase
MEDLQADNIARWLHEQHRAHKHFEAINALSDRGLEFAYNVQERFVAGLPGGGEPIGYKIGLTTPRMQQMCGLDHPIAGFIAAGSHIPSPAALQVRSFVRLGLECEIAVQLREPLDGRNGVPSREQIAARIAFVAAAFEIIEDRAADYKRLDMRSLIADNSWNAGMISAPAQAPVDLASQTGRLWINGKETDSGSTRDVLGHPLNSVEWLCDHLARRNARIEAGQWIMTGSIVPTRFPKPGDHYIFEIEGLPRVEANIV